jgi:RNA polymerase sigma-70 factor (ECF subfamily)
MLHDMLLLQQLKRGSPYALQTIYEKYAPDMLTVAANLLSDPASAEDVVQDVFVSFVQSVQDLTLRKSLKGYLVTCVANRSRDVLRRKIRRPTVAIESAGELPMPAGTASPWQVAADNEDIRRLFGAMTKLPYEQREAIILRLQGDMKFRQIAEMQGVSIKTALSRYKYGLDKLRSMMNGEVSQ